MIDHEQLHEAAADLIEIGVFEIDEVLKWLTSSDEIIVSRRQVIDRVLDVRQTFARYYVLRALDTSAEDGD